MIIYAIYFISLDGKIFLSKYFQSKESMPNESFLGSILTALQVVISKMNSTDDEIKKIVMEGLSIHIRKFPLNRVVVITDTRETPENIIQQLEEHFIREYSVLLTNNTINDFNIFNPFKNVIQNTILTEASLADTSYSIKPTVKLNTIKIYDLPQFLHPTALALVTLSEGTLEEIATESNLSIEDTRKHLDFLQKIGCIGTKIFKDKMIYFCSNF